MDECNPLLDGFSAVAPFYLPYLLPLLHLLAIHAHHAGLGAGPAHSSPHCLRIVSTCTRTSCRGCTSPAAKP